MTDWNMITGISTAVMAGLILVAAIVAWRQLAEISITRKVNAFISVANILQQEEIRQARRVLIGLLRKNFRDWSQEEIDQAERACASYDTAGVAVSENLVGRDLIVKRWRDSIIKCWEAASPMITEYRKERGKDAWSDFENLYEMARRISVVVR